MRKNTFLLVLYFLLLCSCFIEAQERRGVYIWPITFYEKGGLENVFNTLNENKITDIFLLVKGEAGFSIFPSEYTIKDHYKKLIGENKDEKERNKLQNIYDYFAFEFSLDEIINLAHQFGMKIHAWFIISGDRNFVETNPGSEVVRIPNPETNKYPHPVINLGHVNLAYPPYKDYIFSQINKSLEYSFDGLMLDKIRYTNLVYSWDDIHLSKALRAGIDIDKVIDIALNSVYGGDENKDDMFIKYREGDEDIRKWIQIKKEDIEEYVIKCREITKEKNIELSASFMPEGAYDLEFSDVHYAQNYNELSKYFDYIVIMAYPQNFSQPESWIKMVTASAKKISSCDIWIAIQGFDDVEDGSVFKQVKNSRITSAEGIVVFRFGGMTSGMWDEFREGMTVNIENEKNSQKKGIIYNGRGTSRNSWIKVTDALLKYDNVIPILLNEEKLNEEKIFNDKNFILIPGGSGKEIAGALTENGLSNIDRFISSGGGYIGICAGSFLPIKGYNGNLTEKLQIVNAQAIDIAHWNRGVGIVNLSINNEHPIFAGFQKRNIELEYFNGPVIEPADLNLPAYKVLAQFETEYYENGATKGDMLNKTAILESRYVKGKIILFSPHPELTKDKEWLIINSVKYVSDNK